MHLTFRLLACLFALVGIYLAAALQNGPAVTDAHVCETARRFGITSIPADQCTPSLDLWGIRVAIVVMLLCVVFLMVDAYLVRRKKREVSAANNLSPASYSDRYVELMHIILWIADYSAWGRWQKWQQLVLNGAILGEINALQGASSFLHKAAMNGDIHLQGRLRNTFEYKDVDQHFWRKAAFNFNPDDRTLWRAFVIPCAGVTDTLPDFDSLIVERSHLEKLWPRHDLKIDWLITKLWIRAKCQKVTTAIKKMEPSHLIWFSVMGTAFCALVGIVGLSWQSYRGPQPIVLGPISKPAVTAVPAQQPGSSPDNSSSSVVASVKTTENQNIGLSQEDISTKIDIWRSVEGALMNDFANALNQGDSVIGGWADQVKNNRQDVLTRLSVFRNDLSKVSSRLETLRNEYSKYDDVLDTLNWPRKDNMIEAIDNFAEAIKSMPADLPSNYEGKIRPYAGTLKSEWDRTATWQSTTRRMAETKRKELSNQ